VDELFSRVKLKILDCRFHRYAC